MLVMFVFDEDDIFVVASCLFVVAEAAVHFCVEDMMICSAKNKGKGKLVYIKYRPVVGPRLRLKLKLRLI